MLELFENKLIQWVSGEILPQFQVGQSLKDQTLILAPNTINENNSVRILVSCELIYEFSDDIISKWLSVCVCSGIWTATLCSGCTGMNTCVDTRSVKDSCICGSK